MLSSVPVQANVFVVRVRDGYKYISFGIDAEEARALIHRAGHKEPALDCQEVVQFETDKFAAAGFLASASAFAPDIGVNRTLTARHYVLFPTTTRAPAVSSAVAELERRHTGTVEGLIERLSAMTEGEARASLTALCLQAVEVPAAPEPADPFATLELPLSSDEPPDPTPPVRDPPVTRASATPAPLPPRHSAPREAPTQPDAAPTPRASSLSAPWLAIATAGAGLFAAMVLLVVVLIQPPPPVPPPAPALLPTPPPPVPAPAQSFTAPSPPPTAPRPDVPSKPANVTFALIAAYPTADGRSKVVVQASRSCERANARVNHDTGTTVRMIAKGAGRFEVTLEEDVRAETIYVECSSPPSKEGTKLVLPL